MQREFNFEKLIKDVFEISGTEKFLIMTDVPHRGVEDNLKWEKRRAMAEEWRANLEALGLQVAPIASYAATGNHNADLPESVEQLDIERTMANVLEEVDIVLVMSEYSATAPMVQLAQTIPQLRVASMPQLEKRMETSALATDYSKLREQGRILKILLEASQGARVHFETGHEIYFDLRFRNAIADVGYCPPDQDGVRLINLPSGEVFQAPYEGEREDTPSATIGVIPVLDGEDRIQLYVEENKVAGVLGSGRLADRYRELFEQDPASCNIAEFGLGFNDAAQVKGNILEDEKAGFHWAYGRSDHIGGTVGPDQFASPGTVIHQDVVYANGSPIRAEQIFLSLEESGEDLMLMDAGKYIFPSAEEMDELGLT